VKGCFVVIEGLDGAGKTSQINGVVEKLIELGFDAVGTCEPTKSETGKLCRKYLKDENSDVRVDALLFAADRIEHYNQVVLPLLQAGKIVISDRYKMSSYVYQQSQGAPLEWLKEINKYAPEADLTIYLDISIETSINRIKESEDEKEKFENRESLKRIKNLYESFKNGFIRVDAERSRNLVTEEITSLIKSKCNL